MKAKLLGLLIVCSVSFVSVAEEYDSLAVTPENCGELTLEKCKVAMDWARQQIEASKARVKAHREDIANMHEEALELLSKDAQDSE